jgi:hypothetical protein
MTRVGALFSLLMIAVALSAGATQAQPIRTFVAQTGNDANPCTFASPCKSVQHAHDIVAPGGEVRMLDPGSYGLLTINKSISILGDGHGGIAAQNGSTAITVNAGSADKINIRGVVLEGFGNGLTGIKFNTGGSLTVVESVVRNFTLNGIDFASSTGGGLIVSNTVISDNGGNAIVMSPSGAFNTFGAFTRVEAYNNAQVGFRLIGSSLTSTFRLTVKAVDCVLQNINGFTSSSVGASVVSTSGDVTLTLYRSAVSGFSNGAIANDAHSHILVAQSSFEGSANGTVSGTGISSYADNYLGGDLPTVSDISKR